MDWIFFAEQHRLRINFTPNGMRRPILGMVLHITDGHPNFGGLVATWSHPDRRVSAHFAIARRGTIAQFVSMNDVAFAVGGDRQSNDDARWLSVENVARPGESLTDQQISSNGLLLAWLHKLEDIPLQITDNRSVPGLGYHGMFLRAHLHCPGAPVIAQRNAILESARGWLERTFGETS